MRELLQPEFGRRLRACRTELRLKQSDLASEGLTQSYISHLESGRREPTLQVVSMLAERLAVPVDRLTGRHSDEALGVALTVARAEYVRLRGQDAGNLPARALERAGTVHDRVRGLCGLAATHERDGDLVRAVRLLEEAVAALAGATDPISLELVTTASTALSRCYREAGDVHRAVDVAAAAVDRLGDARPRPRGFPQLVATLAFAHTDRGDLLRASVVLDELLGECGQGDDRSGRAAAYWNASLVAADRGELVEALRLIERASALIAEEQDDRALARIKISRAWILMSLPIPDPAGATALLEAALPELRRHAAATDLASAHTELARAALAMDRLPEAVAHAEEAIGILHQHPNVESARAAAVLGQALLALGERERGLQCMQSAATTLTQVGASRECAVLWRQLGELYAQSGSPQQAVDAYTRALDVLGVRGEVLEARLPVGSTGPVTGAR